MRLELIKKSGVKFFLNFFIRYLKFVCCKYIVMDAKLLYERMEKDFILPNLSDEWDGIDPIAEYVCDNFKKRNMGLVCDFSKEIKSAYTAVFPTDEVMSALIEKDVSDSMLFLHHPMIWDIRESPNVFLNMDKSLLEEFMKRRISIYALHVPLDNFNEYSTSNTLAKVLGVKVDKTFAEYYGGMCGVMGTIDLESVSDLRKRYENVLGHKVSLYGYGDGLILNQRVAIVAGGGNSTDILEEVAKDDVNVFITGITALNSHSKKAHDFDKAHKINVLGGTHYSTEKFACIAMAGYFRKLGLESEFVEGEPIFEDL
jgi:putative NIF3 family GTP cyclohydrolase 1 type 2